MLIQFHLLQNYQPSNLNRDDTGSPKDAIFGGALRGRISSQCLKRSIRRSEVFKNQFAKDGLLGERTKLLPQIIREELVALGAETEVTNAIVDRVPEIGRESTKNKKAPEDDEAEENSEPEDAESKIEGTAQLIFIDRKTEARHLAAKLLEIYKKTGAKKWKDTKIFEITKELGDCLPCSVDIAMFGRMTTSQAFKNIQASVQVAHPISTNALKQEFDYFTAVDDISGKTGAEMIGDIEFNSCTYYKYLNIHWEELVNNLGGDKEIARRAVLALLEAAAFAHPSGKQNGFGAFNLPDFILVEVSDANLPVSYANAFLKPVSGYGEKSLMVNSVKQMSEYVSRLSKAYNLQPQRAYLAVDDLVFLNLKAQASLQDLKSWLAPQLVL